MCYLKTVTVREVRQQFSRKVEAPLLRGETLILCKREKMLGHIVPESSKPAFPDFAARQKKIFGNRTIQLNVAEMLRKERNRF